MGRKPTPQVWRNGPRQWHFVISQGCFPTARSNCGTWRYGILLDVYGVDRLAARIFPRQLASYHSARSTGSHRCVYGVHGVVVMLSVPLENSGMHSSYDRVRCGRWACPRAPYNFHLYFHLKCWSSLGRGRLGGELQENTGITKITVVPVEDRIIVVSLLSFTSSFRGCISSWAGTKVLGQDDDPYTVHIPACFRKNCFP